MTADLACAIADGARVISDFRVMSDQRELFGLVASVPTAWRALKEMAWRGAGGPADHGGGEYGPAARVGAGRGPARRAARGAAGGPDPGRGDLHQARDLATRYTLACAAADAGDWEQALIAFMMIADVEPGYRDVRERAETIRRQQQIEALQVEGAPASPGPAVGGRHTDRGAAVPAGPGRRGPGGMVTSARNELVATQQTGRLEADYQTALRLLDAGHWHQAIDKLERIVQVNPAYRAAPALLNRARRQLAEAKPPPQQPSAAQAKPPP